MKLLLASVVLVALLVVGNYAHAGAADLSFSFTFTPTGRCLEQPVSLALAIADYEINHAWQDHAPSARPTAPPPASRHPVPPARTCRSPDEPGCQVSSPAQPPLRVPLDPITDGVALPPTAGLTVVPARPLGAYPFPTVIGRALDGYAPPPWRPPTN